MKLLRVDFDEHEMPATADMRLTVTEVALLYNLTGRTSPVDVIAAAEAAGGDGRRWSDASDSLADGASKLLNTFWEAGVEDVAPTFGVTEIAAQRTERRRPHDDV